jgi:hypothetical protein
MEWRSHLIDTFMCIMMNIEVLNAGSTTASHGHRRMMLAFAPAPAPVPAGAPLPESALVSNGAPAGQAAPDVAASAFAV